jgi:hypothetical protein
LVPICEFHAFRLKSLPNHGQGGSALLAFTGLKQAHGCDADSGGISELLLIPVD